MAQESRQAAAFDAFEISPEMISAGASELCSLRDDAFGNGSVGLRNAEYIAERVFGAMLGKASGIEVPLPRRKRNRTAR